MGPGSQVNKIYLPLCVWKRQVILFSSRCILVAKMDDFWDMYTEKKRLAIFPGKIANIFLQCIFNSLPAG